ncbi:hypothetical protein JOE30_001760 [Rhodococcus sp. PvP016]|uniref:Uncharacterized protein n=1 Tax=Rhodococcoides corynebacterioides TaxID=53972 RepID=A0ABS2KNF0_9NOCA|nr:hypothetical protein [Rhodococcus corynebacterioides]MBP1115963.1 hypothetical protein [Rhodococcus sp. PvP016]
MTHSLISAEVPDAVPLIPPPAMNQPAFPLHH